MLGQGLTPYLYADYFDDTSLLGIHGALGAIITFAIFHLQQKFQNICKKIWSNSSVIISNSIHNSLCVKVSLAKIFIIIYFICVLGASFFNIIIWGIHQWYHRWSRS